MRAAERRPTTDGGWAAAAAAVDVVDVVGVAINGRGSNGRGSNGGGGGVCRSNGVCRNGGPFGRSTLRQERRWQERRPRGGRSGGRSGAATMASRCGRTVVGQRAPAALSPASPACRHCVTHRRQGGCRRITCTRPPTFSPPAWRSPPHHSNTPPPVVMQELKKMQPACEEEGATCHQWTSLLSDKVPPKYL